MRGWCRDAVIGLLALLGACCWGYIAGKAMRPHVGEPIPMAAPLPPGSE